MKTCGIVVEYNPFHNGHIHHISQTRQITHCDILIAVMSPNFVQRGEPAIIDKWHRTKNALEHGVDLVVELPFIYATQSAEPFAMGAMHLLNLMGCDAFCFGSESHDLQELIRLSQLEKMELDKKKAPVQSYEQMYGTLYANDILGINYLKYSKNMKPYCIKRTNHYFDEQLEENISSATSIRKAVQDQLDISKATPAKIENPVFLKDFYPMIQLLLFTLPKDSLKELFLMDEDLLRMGIIIRCLNMAYTWPSSPRRSRPNSKSTSSSSPFVPQNSMNTSPSRGAYPMPATEQNSSGHLP